MRQQGVLTLREEGVELALAGKTTLDEVLRVTHNDDGEEPIPLPKKPEETVVADETGRAA
jgi:hypothetical protein